MNFEYGKWNNSDESLHRRKRHQRSMPAADLTPRQHAPRGRGEGDPVGKRKKSSSAAVVWFGAIVGVAACLSFLKIITTQKVSTNQNDRRGEKRAITYWRRSVQSKCQALRTEDWREHDIQEKKRAIDQWSLRKLGIPSPERELHLVDGEVASTYTNLFVDLKAKTGTYLGYWVELALDVCTPTWQRFSSADVPFENKAMNRPRFNPQTLEVSVTSGPTSTFRQFLHNWLWVGTLDAKGDAIPRAYPEDFFLAGLVDLSKTNLIRRLEAFILSFRLPIVQSIQLFPNTLSISTILSKRINLASTKKGILMIRAEEADFELSFDAETIEFICKYQTARNTAIIILCFAGGEQHRGAAVARAKLEECGTSFVDLANC